MGKKKAIILASASPRRKQILSLMGIPCRQVISRVTEEAMRGNPRQHVLHYSKLKAAQVALRFKNGVVLGADTVVVYRGRIFGKPSTEREAVKMLSALSGRGHTVITGLTVIDLSRNRTVSGLEATRVHFRKLTRPEIIRYVQSGDPMDKAGAYGIQEKGCRLVKKVEGCFYNVMGLPVARLIDLLDKIGFKY